MLPPKYFCLALALTATGLSPASAEPPSFSQDVRPLLSDRCLKCHGPDDKGRKGNLRLDLRDDALTGGKSGAAGIVPGNISDSEILRRMRSTDPDEVMRPRVLVLVAAPMVRAALSEPESRPPLARVSVSGLAPTKFTVLAALLRVRELMVWPPLRTLCVPLKRTLLEAVAAARVTVCSTLLIGRMPATAS